MWSSWVSHLNEQDSLPNHATLQANSGTKSSLTLTAASRAYLMEPQWNPAIEEQALARICRIGQEKDVTTVRFVMNKSIEQVRT